MKTRNFFTKDELIKELGISKSTFYRRIKDLNISISRRLLTAFEAESIRNALVNYESKSSAEGK